MAFHTWQFGVFLVLMTGLFWLVARHRNVRTGLLLAASYVFYGSWEVWFLALIVFSTVLDYHCGRWIAAARGTTARRVALLASLTGNLGLLCWFKYTGWLADLVEPLLSSPDAAAMVERFAWHDVVPVGISFYTFQTLSYTLDLYRGRMQPARNFWDFALFVSFFPQLVAGPIVRAIEFLPQLDLAPRFDRARLHDGLHRIGVGLAKKALLADQLARFLVDPCYENPDLYAPSIHVAAMVGFAFQIYFDFSGYSDLAIGTARLFGFDLPENFHTPFRSRSVREFWRRWHITLSSWVRDYVYFPLGGSRGSEARTSANLVVTMVIIGLWHGASVLWLLYGLLQGGAMVVERTAERWRGGRPFATTRARSLLAWAATFGFTSVTLLAVRGTSFAQVRDMLTTAGSSTDLSPWAWALLGASFATHFAPLRLAERVRDRLVALPTAAVGFLLGLVVAAVVFVMSETTAFIYFQF